MSDDTTIDHTYTDNIVCPHCGHEHDDSWEWGSGEGAFEGYECDACGQLFDWSRMVSVSYSTIATTREEHDARLAKRKQQRDGMIAMLPQKDSPR